VPTLRRRCNGQQSNKPSHRADASFGKQTTYVPENDCGCDMAGVSMYVRVAAEATCHSGGWSVMKERSTCPDGPKKIPAHANDRE
jgi:hypothetical protein